MINGLKPEPNFAAAGHNLTFLVNGVKILPISLGDAHEDPV